MNIWTLSTKIDDLDELVNIHNEMDALSPCICYMEITYPCGITFYFAAAHNGIDYTSRSIGKHLFDVSVTAIKAMGQPLIDTHARGVIH